MKSSRHPVTTRLDFANDPVMAAHWGAECATAIRQAVAVPHPTTIEDLWLLHAVRTARVAWWHACRRGRYRAMQEGRA